MRSRRQEIIERANLEYQAAIDRGGDLRAEIHRQRRDVLAHHSPLIASALVAYDAAIGEALRVLEERKRDATDRIAAAGTKRWRRGMPPRLRRWRHGRPRRRMQRGRSPLLVKTPRLLTRRLTIRQHTCLRPTETAHAVRREAHVIRL